MRLMLINIKQRCVDNKCSGITMRYILKGRLVIIAIVFEKCVLVNFVTFKKMSTGTCSDLNLLRDTLRMKVLHELIGRRRFNFTRKSSVINNHISAMYYIDLCIKNVRENLTN